jgi:hypothetical protein
MELLAEAKYIAYLEALGAHLSQSTSLLGF